MRDVLRFEDLAGAVLLVQLDQYDDHLAVLVEYELAGERIASKWVQLTPIQARELAEAILGRFGGSDESLG